MSDSSPIPGLPPDHEIYEQMDQWAGKRKPRDLCLELGVRLAQLAIIVQNALRTLGLAEDGTPAQHTESAGIVQLPIVPPGNDPPQPCPNPEVNHAAPPS